MRTQLRLLLLGLIAFASASRAFAADPAPAIPSDDAWKTGWPTMTGPTGNMMPLRSATPLVDDLAMARLLWISEDRDLGSAKTGSQTWVNSQRVESFIGPDAKDFKGNWAGVVVADGKVYGSSWVPAGPVYTAPYKTNKPYQKGPTPLVPTRFRVEADDVVLCFDANTGKVLWKSREPGGLIRAGGKRGGIQVAMAIDSGRAFSLGSTGRLFAHDANTGKKLWQADVGPAHKASEILKAQSIATAQRGEMVIPDGAEWFTSLVVADGVLVTGDYSGGTDTGLRGYDAATGQLKWQAPSVISPYATPNVWRHNTKAWLLAATNSGALRLLDPQTGTPAWTIIGLGRNWTTLGPGQATVMVNVKPTVDKRTPGIWGAYRISPEKAELAWKLDDQPCNYIPTWMDTGARELALVRDGKVLLHTEGDKTTRGRALLLDESDGSILAQAPNGSSDLTSVDELILWLGDRAFVRADHSHGSTHGGRHPLVAWRTRPGDIAPILDEGHPGGLDLAEFDTAYEVLMHVPLVDGRMFERTDDGRLACYDLRVTPNASIWSLGLAGAYVGLPTPVPTRICATDKAVTAAKVWIADSNEAALPTGTVRRRPTWETAGVADLQSTGQQITGTLQLNFGTHRWPVELALKRNADTIAGTWTRRFPAASQKQAAQGTIAGQANDIRGFPTPWLKETPWTAFGKNPPGTRTLILGLDKAIPLRGEPKGLTLSLDHDGKSFTRAAGVAFQYSQSWHEVDATSLRLDANHITGQATVILNIDVFLSAKEDPAAGAVGLATIDATIDPEGKITGTYSISWGEPYEAKGLATGKIAPQSP